MIVKMLHIDILCVAAEQNSTLESLRALGAVHLDLSSQQDEAVLSAKAEAADAEKAVFCVLKARGKKQISDFVVRTPAEVLALQEKIDADKASLDEFRREIVKYEPFGDFDPALAQKLISLGVDLSSVADLPSVLPPMRLSEMKLKASKIEQSIEECLAALALTDEKSIIQLFPEIEERIQFASAKELMLEKGAVSIISGWLPQRNLSQLKDLSVKEGWGILSREPIAGETPPTLVEPPKFFKPMKVLFDGLGIAPAYEESDVSVPFMCYFSLFFAMLVGDGAYGAIFLAATIALRKKLSRSWVVLLSVFSVATVLWGVLSNTWFGAQIPFLKNLPTVEWLADPSYRNMMLLCFTIGASHLMLARIWNGICKLPDSTAVAEFAWAGILLFMYLVTNSIVGIFPSIPSWAFPMLYLSLAGLFLFSVKPSELKSRGAELGMLPLNIMSALGDIISYVRLFAVGLASVKVAENFNSMATGLVEGAESFWLKAVMSIAMVAILVMGHALNLAMAGLSILVHAVRLNTLEFSNHKGVTWSGVSYNPFKRKKQTKQTVKKEKTNE
jgi:V/A-type H+-transporting ATPase subunit I